MQNEEECRKIKEVVAQDQMKTIQQLKEVRHHGNYDLKLNRAILVKF